MFSCFQLVVGLNLGNLATILIGMFKISNAEIKLEGANLLKKMADAIMMTNGLVTAPYSCKFIVAI